MEAASSSVRAPLQLTCGTDAQQDLVRLHVRQAPILAPSVSLLAALPSRPMQDTSLSLPTCRGFSCTCTYASKCTLRANSYSTYVTTSSAYDARTYHGGWGSWLPARGCTVCIVSHAARCPMYCFLCILYKRTSLPLWIKIQMCKLQDATLPAAKAKAESPGSPVPSRVARLVPPPHAPAGQPLAHRVCRIVSSYICYIGYIKP